MLAERARRACHSILHRARLPSSPAAERGVWPKAGGGWMARKGVSAVPDYRHEGDGTVHAAIVVPGNASTILTHVFGRGLPDERYVVERFQAMSDRDIRRAPGDVTPANGHLSVSRPRTCRIAAASPKYSVLSRPSSHRRATLWTTGHTLKALGTRRGRLLPMASLGALRCRAGLQYLSCPHVAV